MEAEPVNRNGWLSLQRWGLRRLDIVAARRHKLASSAPHLATGLLGEREALFYLRSLGYVVVAQRWRTARLRGDVDLIAWDGEYLCFIEVKTRSQRNPMEPAESAVDEEKQRMLRRMAQAYLKGFPHELRGQVLVRFDVMSVYLRPAGISAHSSQPAEPEFELRRGSFARD
jgi:putative endonuclease